MPPAPQNARCGNLRAEEKEAVIECCRLNARVVLIAPQHGPRPQEGPKETQKWYQRGPNMVPNMAQDGPTRTQDGPKWPQDGPSTGLGSILVPFWLHVGALSGSKKHSQMKLNFNTISDAVLGQILEPFSGQNWTNLRVLSDMS